MEKSVFFNNLYSVLLAFINVNCFDRPVWRFRLVFPQKRKCYFYPQCMPLSADTVVFDSYQGFPTVNILFYQ